MRGRDAHEGVAGKKTAMVAVEAWCSKTPCAFVVGRPSSEAQNGIEGVVAKAVWRLALPMMRPTTRHLRQRRHATTTRQPTTHGHVHTPGADAACGFAASRTNDFRAFGPGRGPARFAESASSENRPPRGPRLRCGLKHNPSNMRTSKLGATVGPGTASGGCFWAGPTSAFIILPDYVSYSHGASRPLAVAAHPPGARACPGCPELRSDPGQRHAPWADRRRAHGALARRLAPARLKKAP